MTNPVVLLVSMALCALLAMISVHATQSEFLVSGPALNSRYGQCRNLACQKLKIDGCPTRDVVLLALRYLNNSAATEFLDVSKNKGCYAAMGGAEPNLWRGYTDNVSPRQSMLFQDKSIRGPANIYTKRFIYFPTKEETEQYGLKPNTNITMSLRQCNPLGRTQCGRGEA